MKLEKITDLISDIKDFVAYHISELVVLVILFGGIALIGGLAIHHEKVNMHEAYHAWVKQTDNPKALTYEEWRALNRANRNTIVVIPR